jgi:hypothetical protein
VYSLPVGEVIKRITYVILYFGNTVLAIDHTLGFSHKQNMQDELQFAILPNLKVAQISKFHKRFLHCVAGAELCIIL